MTPLEKAARAMEPSAFETYDRGYTQRNGHDLAAFLNAERTVRRARKKVTSVLTSLLDPPESVIACMAEIFDETEGFGTSQRAETAFNAAIRNMLEEG